MTKAELVGKVAAAMRLPKHQTETVVNLFLQCITDALEEGDKVELRGFGSFRLHHRRPRAGRNPKTGETVQIPAKKVPWRWLVVNSAFPSRSDVACSPRALLPSCASANSG